MPKFNVVISSMKSSSFEVEASNEDEATEKAQHKLDFEDCSDLEWATVRKSVGIDAVDEL